MNKGVPRTSSRVSNKGVQQISVFEHGNICRLLVSAINLCLAKLFDVKVNLKGLLNLNLCIDKLTVKSRHGSTARFIPWNDIHFDCGKGLHTDITKQGSHIHYNQTVEIYHANVLVNNHINMLLICP